jgi:hypothetical protein
VLTGAVVHAVHAPERVRAQAVHVVIEDLGNLSAAERIQLVEWVTNGPHTTRGYPMGNKITRGLVLAAAAAGVTFAGLGIAQAAPGPYLYGACTPIQGGVTTLQPGQAPCTADNGQPGVKWVLRPITTQGGVTSNQRW